ncbi:alpha/beta fold hydrolase [Enemella sp. A6]|uniref:alpha/beta fold hydrolase n=1 Tax=Enemella sp. A6 TaxID=3440152 RepID=UPI003EBF353D
MTELTHESTQRELATDNGVLRYHEAGEGPPLLLLHGSGPGVTGWRNFKGNLGVFAEHFHTYILEFPGFGVSDDTDLHPMMAALPAVTDFLDGLGIDKVDIIGNSMGGIVGTNFAMQSPDRLGKLVTIGGMGVAMNVPSPAEGINLLVDFTANPTRDGLIRWLQSMVYDQSMITEELIEERWALATEPATLEFSKRMYNKAAMSAPPAADRPPYWSMLHTIKAEVLLTWGRDDRVSPVDMATLPMRMIPNAELHVLPKCGHWAMIEQKERWEAAVLSFLLRPPLT